MEQSLFLSRLASIAADSVAARLRDCSFHCKFEHTLHPLAMASTTPQDGSYNKSTLEQEGESETAQLKRLGRQRPESFTSRKQEIAFVFSIVMSQAILEYFVTGFIILIPPVVQALDIPPAAVTWPASAFSLVVSSFLLVFGRVADIYGGFPVYVVGMAWYCVWALVAGFSQNELMLVMCRALQGLG